MRGSRAQGRAGLRRLTQTQAMGWLKGGRYSEPVQAAPTGRRFTAARFTAVSVSSAGSGGLRCSRAVAGPARGPGSSTAQRNRGGAQGWRRPLDGAAAQPLSLSASASAAAPQPATPPHPPLWPFSLSLPLSPSLFSSPFHPCVTSATALRGGWYPPHPPHRFRSTRSAL